MQRSTNQHRASKEISDHGHKLLSHETAEAIGFHQRGCRNDVRASDRTFTREGRGDSLSIHFDANLA
jgi:hypothetical protein